MAGGVVGKLVKKYAVVIFFPTFTATTIYADWSHTRNWKREIKEKTKNQELLTQ